MDSFSGLVVLGPVALTDGFPQQAVDLLAGDPEHPGQLDGAVSLPAELHEGPCPHDPQGAHPGPVAVDRGRRHLAAEERILDLVQFGQFAQFIHLANCNPHRLQFATSPRYTSPVPRGTPPSPPTTDRPILTRKPSAAPTAETGETEHVHRRLVELRLRRPDGPQHPPHAALRLGAVHHPHRHRAERGQRRGPYGRPLVHRPGLKRDMTTIWRKFRGLPTWAQILAVVAVLGLVGAAGGSGSGKTEPKEQAASGAVDQQSTSTTASTASPTPARFT